MPKKKSPSAPITLDVLGTALANTGRDWTAQNRKMFGEVGDRIGGLEQEVRRLQGEMREGFHQVDIKLDAALKLLATRRQLQNLVRELREQGIKLDEARIFAA